VWDWSNPTGVMEHMMLEHSITSAQLNFAIRTLQAQFRATFGDEIADMAKPRAVKPSDPAPKK